MVRNTNMLTYSAGARAFLLLAYTNIPKENDSYFILFHVGVASCIYDLRVDL